MRWPGLVALPSFLCTLWLAGPLAADPAEITAIVVDLKQLQQTEDVHLIRAASTVRVPLVLGVKLELGDSLENLSGKPVVELKCPNGTIYTFRNKFRVVLIPPSQAGCAVDVLSGSLDVLADQPTEVNAGGVRLGSEGTVYSVTVDSSAGAQRLRVAVFEDEVKIPGEEPIGQGAALTITTKSRRRSPIDRFKDVFPLAASFARLDVARARNAERASKAFQLLKERHAEVLTMPDNREHRIALARTQLYYDVRNGNVSYQLRRLGMTERDLQNPEPVGRPDPDQGGTLDCAVRILEHRPSEEVEGKFELAGSARVPEGHHLWVFVRPMIEERWFPAEGTFDAFDGSTWRWSAIAYLPEAETVSSDLELTAAVVTQEQHQGLQGRVFSQPGKPQPIRIPATTCIAAVVKVKRSPSTSRPDTPPEGLDGCTVRIREPRPSQKVPGRIEVVGNARIPDGHHLWVFARRIDFSSLWWPQGEGTVDDNGKWRAVAILGEPRDVGEVFELTAAIFPPVQHQRLLSSAVKSGEPRPIEMPAAACAAEVVEVKRTKW